MAKAGGIADLKTLYALYAHLSRVVIGQVIGSTGISGNAVGEPPHLHFEILLKNELTHQTPRVDPGDVLGYGLSQC
jgi:murein DD-endopeptidase MepM/ murein hydrolase activator NlpD